MKKVIVTGVLILTGSFAIAAGGAKVARPSAEARLESYTDTVRITLLKGKSFESLDKGTQDAIIDRIVFELKMPQLSGKVGEILKETRDPNLIDGVLSIAAAKQFAAAQKDSAVRESIDAAANETAQLVVNSNLIELNKPSRSLTESQVSTVFGAIKKTLSLRESILTKFSKAERDSYTAVIKRFNEKLNPSAGGAISRTSPAEHFIAAIMEVKNVSRDEALKIAEKLKDCV